MTSGFHTLTIAEVIDETADARSIRFALPDNLRDAFAFRRGSTSP
jgi:ferredoxin-NADP reductase